MVIVRNGRQLRVTGRAAKIISWLAANADRLAQHDKLTLQFNCAGPNVTAEVRERERLKE